MKTLIVCRKITLSILLMIVLLCSTQTASYAGIDSVKPGDNDTSLIVTFTESIWEGPFTPETKTYLFQWRQKIPQSDWKSVNKTYTYYWATYVWPAGSYVSRTKTFTITGLNPGTVYEVRYDSGAIHEGTTTTNSTPLLISTAPALTEATLGNGTVTLTLNNDAYEQNISYEQDITKIRDAVTVSGINGVTVDTASVQRFSDTEITVELDFDGTDFDADTVLIFSMGAGAIADYTGEAFTVEILVPAVKERVVASVVSALTEATLDEGMVTLTLIGETYESDVSTIRNAVMVSGINGVTVDTATVQRLSDTEITVELDFTRTNLDTDATLTFSVGAGAVTDYTGEAFTAEISVTAVKKEVSASAASPLTEATLDEGVVTLTLSYDTYETDVSTIRDAVTVSGINGVTVDTASVQRLSDTEITVELDFDGTDFDINTALIFSTGVGAIADYAGEAFTAEISVIAVKEAVSASVVSPLTEATLDGGIVTLILRSEIYEQDISKIRNAVTVSGINGVTVDTASVQRLGDTDITVELDFDGTDFVQDRALTFSVDAGAIVDYAGDAFTAEIPVTANRGEAHLIIFWTDWFTDKIQRANLDGSNVQDLVTQGLDSPRGIALDVASGKMYWTDWFTDKIQRANLDGSNVQDLVTQGLDGPNSIALDVASGKMYWTGWFTDKIQRANLDGSNVQDLVTQGLSGLKGIALDVASGKMYWTDWFTDKIQRANLDGSNVQDLVTQGLDGPRGIALDVAGGKMYWTDSGTGKIQRANLDGSNVENLGIPGLRGPSGIALGIIFPVNSTTAEEDVNRDGVVDITDLVIVARRYGRTGTNAADVNGDEIVNVDDFTLVAAEIDNAPAAPAARAQVRSHFTAAQLQGWLAEARASGKTSRTYQRGIAVLEQLLALLAPEETALLANYPNPFNPETWIPYHLSNDSDVLFSIYDINGALVRELDLGHQRAGYYTDRSRAAYWDGRNELGERVASGVYFYQLRAGDYLKLRKMVIVK